MLNSQNEWLDEDVSALVPRDGTQKPSIENNNGRKRLLRDRLNQNSGTNFDPSVNCSSGNRCPSELREGQRSQMNVTQKSSYRAHN